MSSADLLDAPTMTEERPKPLSVKLHMDVIESARIVAACKNVSMTDMLSDILRPILSGMEREELAKRARSTKPSKPEGPTRPKGSAQ